MLTCGVDLIEVARVHRVAEKHGDHFLRRIFTPVEIDYCAGRPNPWPHYAARFAAKEAFYKAVPPGVLPALVWVEIGVVHGGPATRTWSSRGDRTASGGLELRRQPGARPRDGRGHGRRSAPGLRSRHLPRREAAFS